MQRPGLIQSYHKPRLGQGPPLNFNFDPQPIDNKPDSPFLKIITHLIQDIAQGGQTDPEGFAQKFIPQMLEDANLEVVLRSQISPDININISELARQEFRRISGLPNTLGQEEDNKPIISNERFLRIAKPQLIMRYFGLERSIAPYGEPTQALGWVAFASLLGISLVGVAVGVAICRKVIC